MESRHFRRKRFSGLFPQYGAIFMADNSTRKECFQRKIFGLPSNFADFVTKVKAGMLLFLFDYQERKLYGVFKAISDGAINIVPQAYRSSKRKQFPAQVCFSIIWRCVPVPEEAFRDAIGENYFAPYKFNFGLSREQVKRLLVLFEKRRIEIKVSRNLMRRRKWQTGCNETNSDVESKPDSEASSESLSENSACLAISDNGNATDLDGCEPLPSTDTEKLENSLPDELAAAEDFIPLPAIDLEETKDPLPDGLVECPFNLFGSQQEYDALQSAIDSLFSEVGGCSLQEEPEPQNDDREEGEKQIDNGCYRVNGLYSDSAKERTSVFLRLSGLSKVIKQEKSHLHDKIDYSGEILGRLEKTQKKWKKVSTTYDEPKASKARISVFSRLSYNVGHAPEREPSERISASAKKCAIPAEFPQKKRKNHTMEILCEVEGIIAMMEEQSETNKRICTSKNSWETKICDCSSTGLVLPSGSSASTVNCESCDAACKSDEGSSEVALEEPIFSDLTGRSSTDKSFPENATKSMVKEFQPCPSASSGVEELSQRASVIMYAAEVGPNSSVEGNCEPDLKLLPPKVDTSTEVCPIIT